MKLAIGLGASLGDRRQRLELTLQQLAGPGMRLVRASRWYASPPLAGGSARNYFLNGVGLYECTLPLDQVLARCQALEHAAGRRRARFWGDRPLDLDLLVAEDTTLSTPALTLPHPAIGRRAFVLWPLLEVWPDVWEARHGLIGEAKPALPHPWPVGIAARPPVAADVGSAYFPDPRPTGRRNP